MRIRRTFLPMLICFSLLLTSFNAVLAQETPHGLQKDTSGTYLIHSADELFAFAELVKSTAEADKTAGSTRTPFSAKLMADINLNPGTAFTYDHAAGLVTVTKDGAEYKMGTGLKGTELGSFQTEPNLRKWTPIGTKDLPYIGFFDGDGHTIDGLYINDSEIKYTGLFGATGNYANVPGFSVHGEVKNLTIGQNSLVVGYDASNNGATGAVAGITNGDIISGCTSRATVVGKGNLDSYKYTHGATLAPLNGHVGGIAGLILGKVQNCTNYGTVVSKESAGGIVGNVMGVSENYGSIHYCTNYGKVYADSASGSGRAGGIAVNAGGEEYVNDFADQITACTNYGEVEGGLAAGIVQRVARQAKILYCANRGKVTASSSAAGIVEFTGRTGMYMKGCYNAAELSLSSADSGVSELYRTVYPIANRIYTYSTDGGSAYHIIDNCFNDSTVCPSEDDALCGEKFTAVTDCRSVSSEVFASGKAAYEMGSYYGIYWKQSLPIPEEDGKIPEKYPTINGTKYVYKQTHYCCHTDEANRTADKITFYSNRSGDITDEHTPNEYGFCSHCKKDLRRPIISPSALPEGKVGEFYDVYIYTNETPQITEYEFVASETDDTPYTFEEFQILYDRDRQRINIYGTPTKPGTYSFALKATNENGTSTQSFTVIVKEAPFEITTDEKLSKATAGESCSYLLQTNHLTPVWSLEKGSELPKGLTLDEKSGEISGTPEKDGQYTFTIIASADGKAASKTFSLSVLEEGGCTHKGMTMIKGTEATCYRDGVADYYHCGICERDFSDEHGENELFIYNELILKTAAKHSDANSDSICDLCKRNMPIFKKVTSESDIIFGGTYILAAEIDGEHYALALPPEIDYGGGDWDREYNELMGLCKVTPDANGIFTFNELDKKGAVMLKTEFLAENGWLSAGMPRYDFSSVFDNKRYGFYDNGSCFGVISIDSASYGGSITLDASGKAIIGSIYQKWSASEASDNGFLRAFDMDYEGTNTKVMTFYSKDRHTGTYGNYNGAEMTDCPIYLYRMTDVGNADGVSFTVNDAKSTVDNSLIKESLKLSDDADLSNVYGIADAVSQTAVAAAVSAAADAQQTNAYAQIYADISATDFTTETDEKGNKITASVTYSVTPKITVTGADESVLSTNTISDSDFSNGTPITVTLHTGGVYPEQIIHYKADGTKEYFYPDNSGKYDSEETNGKKTFKYANGFVTFTITEFSDFKILAAAEPEGDMQNGLCFDGKTLTATVDKDGAYTVIFAGYETDGRISYLKTSAKSFTSGTHTVEIPENVDISKVTKIYLWNTFSQMLPVCGALDI